MHAGYIKISDVTKVKSPDSHVPRAQIDYIVPVSLAATCGTLQAKCRPNEQGVVYL